MRKHLGTPETWSYNNSMDTLSCLAIYTMGPWKLHSPSWSRLTEWMQPLCKAGILYSVGGTEGVLHFTLHQCSRFYETKGEAYDGDFIEPLVKKLAGLRIVFRGLLVTRTGIALRGYPSTQQGLEKLMEVRNALSDTFQRAGVPFDPPYINDICHATLFRWTHAPTQEMIEYIQKGIDRWSECILAEIAPSRWSFGYASLRMHSNELAELARFWTPEKIAHRGLIAGPNKNVENSITTITELCEQGRSSEIDIWWHKRAFWIGHDEPKEPVNVEFLRSEFLWIHAKNTEAFYQLQKLSNEKGWGLRIFYHTDEDYVLTTRGDTIIYPGLPDVDGWIYMMPEMSTVLPCVAAKVCSDFS